MAELPKYQRTQVLTEMAPAAEPANLTAGVKTFNVMNKALDQLSQYALEGAERYARESAIEFNLDNPVTTEQYKEAVQTGKDPVKQFRTGGMIYNDTIRKLYASQAATGLVADTQEHYENVLRQVQRGEIKDPNEIKRTLTDPINGYAEVIQRMDPATAATFRSRSNYYGHTYYRRAMSELNTLNEFETQQTVDKFNDGLLKTWTEGLKTSSTPDDIKELKDIILADATETYRNTGKFDTNMNALKSKLNSIEQDSLAVEIAKEAYRERKPLDQVMQEMTLNNNAGRMTAIYADKFADEQADIRAKVKTEYNNIDTNVKVSSGSINKSLTNIDNRLKKGELVDFGEYDAKMLSADADQLAKYDTLREKQKINALYKGMNFNQLEQEIIDAEQNKPIVMTEEESEIYNHKLAARDLIQKQVDEDPVAYALQHPAYQSVKSSLLYDPARADEPGYLAEFQQQFEQRAALREQFALDFKKPNVSLFSKQEVAYYKNMFDQASATDMVNIVTNLTDAYGGNDYELFKELAKDSDAARYAHLGNLVVSAQSVPSDVRNMTTIEKLSDGIQIARNDEVVKLYKFDNTEMNQEVGNVLGEAYEDQARQVVVESAKHIYYSLNKQRPEEWNNTLWKDALEMATGKNGDYGGIVNYRGSMHPVPPNVNRNLFGDMLEDATIDDLRMVAEDAAGNPLQSLAGEDNIEYTLEQIQRADIDFISRDSAVLTGQKLASFLDKVSVPFASQDNRPIAINFAGLYSILKQRYPAKYK
jgi:hypothetical protein